MKKIIALILTLTSLVLVFASCENKKGKGEENDGENELLGSVNVFVEMDHDAVSALIAKGEIDVAILPEPKASAAILNAKNQAQSYSIKLNLSEEWDKVSETQLPMGCIVAKNSFIDLHEGAVVEFLKEYKASIEYVGNPENKDSAASMIVNAGIIPKLPLAKSSLDNLYGSIVYMDSSEMKNSLVAFYDAIGIQNPADEFYYTPNASAVSDGAKIKIGVMNGPTGMGMAKLVNDYGLNSDKYEFVLFSSPETANLALINGEIDLACLPTNAAANLANKNSDYISVAAINCLGSLYVLAKDGVEINSIADLKDKNVYYGVKTSTTEPILKYILSKNKLGANVIE